MEVLASATVSRIKCLQMECETGIKLLNQIMENNSKILQNLLNESDNSYYEKCMDYQHESQMTVMQATLILQKFLRTPVPKVINTAHKMIVYDSELESITNIDESISTKLMEIMKEKVLTEQNAANSSLPVNGDCKTDSTDVKSRKSSVYSFQETKEQILIDNKVEPRFTNTKTTTNIDKEAESILKAKRETERELLLAKSLTIQTDDHSTKPNLPPSPSYSVYSAEISQHSNATSLNSNVTTEESAENKFQEIKEPILTEKNNEIEPLVTDADAKIDEETKPKLLPKKETTTELLLAKSPPAIPTDQHSVNTVSSQSHTVNNFAEVPFSEYNKKANKKLSLNNKNHSCDQDVKKVENVPFDLKNYADILRNDGKKNENSKKTNKLNNPGKSKSKSLLYVKPTKQLKQTRSQKKEFFKSVKKGCQGAQKSKTEDSKPDLECSTQLKDTKIKSKEPVTLIEKNDDFKYAIKSPPDNWFEAYNSTTEDDEADKNNLQLKELFLAAPSLLKYCEQSNIVDVQEKVQIADLTIKSDSLSPAIITSETKCTEEVPASVKSSQTSCVEFVFTATECKRTKSTCSQNSNEKNLIPNETDSVGLKVQSAEGTLQSNSLSLAIVTSDTKCPASVISNQSSCEDFEFAAFECKKTESIFSQNSNKQEQHSKETDSIDSQISQSEVVQSRTVNSIPNFSDGEDLEYLRPVEQQFQEISPILKYKNKKCGGDVVKELKRNNIIPLEERYKQNIPRARMPDISIKPASLKLSQKESSILKNRLSEDIEEVINEENLEYKENVIATHTFVVPHSPSPKNSDFFMISHIISPGMFYIQIVNEISTLIDEISDQLKDLYENNNFIPFSSKFEAKREMGNFFAVQVNDYWMRMEVVDWLVNIHNTKVLLESLDFGGYYERAVASLRPLPNELYKIPRIALQCHLDNLFPINSQDRCPTRNWESSSIRSFVQVCGDIENVYFKLLSCCYCKIRKSYAIEFEKEDGESIGEVLVLTKKAIKIRNRKAEFFENLGLAYDNVYDSYRTPIEQTWNAYCYENLKMFRNCKESYNSNKKEETLRIVTKPNINQDLPCVGEERRIIITHVVDIRTFYGQIDDRDSNHPAESLQIIKELMNSYKGVRSYTTMSHFPSINQLVVALHPKHFWSRAQVRDIDISDEDSEVNVELFFVDYGCVEWVPLSSIRNINNLLLGFPYLAIEFRIYNIKHREGASLAMEKDFLELYMNTDLTITVKSVPGHVQVELRDQNHMDVAETLINNGIGEWNEIQIFPSADSNLLMD